MKLQVVRANHINFTCYTRGAGKELLLMLHGFPDDAATMLRLMESLDTDRFTLVAPHLRGLGPSSRAPDRRYLYRELGQDVLGLIEALGFEQAHVYAHDFGALAGYAASQLAPERITHLIAASIPPPVTFVRNLPRSPRQIARSWHILLMQIPWLGKRLLGAQDEALVSILWRLWSPGWRWERDRLAKVKNTLNRQGAKGTIVRYYRGLLLDALLDHAAWRSSFTLAMRPIQSPTSVVHGVRDGCMGSEMFRGIEHAFLDGTPHRVYTLEDCGHFPHLERLERVRGVILRGAPTLD